MKPMLSYKYYLAAFGAFLLAFVAAQSALRRTETDKLPDVRKIVVQYMVETRTPGLSVAVQVRDSLVWVEGFGLADVEHNVPVQVFTRFRVGSVSKALTSVAVGLLYEQGLLDLDVPVQTYVSSFPEKQYPVTTRQLAGHLSGLPHYQSSDFINLVHYEGVVEALDKFKDRPLLFEPGERFHYSSFGFNLISAVVEGAAEMPFLEYMDEAVFEPLGMGDTEADRYDAIIPHRTSFYEVTDDGQLRHASYTDNSDVWAGGGFLSTPSDLVAFGSGLLNGELLQPETLKLLFESMRTNGGEATDYGLGWRISEVEGHHMVGHTGGHFGASAHLLVFPAEQVVVAVTANTFDRMFFGMAAQIAAHFLP